MENQGKGIESYTTNSSMVSQDSVFPPASGLASWPPQCPETPHFSSFLAPEYASQPKVRYCKALSLDKVVALVGLYWESFFACGGCRV